MLNALADGELIKGNVSIKTLWHTSCRCLLMGSASSTKQLSFHGLGKTYHRRKPEQTIMYQAVNENLRTFEALAEAEGKHLPKHVRDEFEAYLKCGILASQLDFA